MISFNNKKILITNADTNIGKELSIKLSNLGAELILIGEDKKYLEEIISQLKNKSTIYKYSFKDSNSFEELTSQLVEKVIKLDGYIHCNFLLEQDIKLYKKRNESNIEYYLTVLENIVKNDCSNNISVLLLLNNLDKTLEHTPQYYYNYYGTSNMAKILSIKYLNKKIRINTILSDTNEDEKLSNMATYLLSTSSQFIVGELYDISNN